MEQLGLNPEVTFEAIIKLVLLVVLIWKTFKWARKFTPDTIGKDRKVPEALKLVLSFFTAILIMIAANRVADLAEAGRTFFIDVSTEEIVSDVFSSPTFFISLGALIGSVVIFYFLMDKPKGGFIALLVALLLLIFSDITWGIIRMVTFGDIKAVNDLASGTSWTEVFTTIGDALK